MAESKASCHGTSLPVSSPVPRGGQKINEAGRELRRSLGRRLQFHLASRHRCAHVEVGGKLFWSWHLKSEKSQRSSCHSAIYCGSQQDAGGFPARHGSWLQAGVQEVSACIGFGFDLFVAPGSGSRRGIIIRPPCSVLVRPHLRHCVKFGVSQSKRDIKLLESVQRRAREMGKGLEG